MTLAELSEKTRYNPLSIHVNPLGLLRVARTNKERFEKFNFILNTVQKYGGNIAIPSYSYSFTSGEVYDVYNTKSELDQVSEYLRFHNKSKRTIDPNFSYLLFGDLFDKKHFKVGNYSSFGKDSLVEELFLKDGYLGTIGNILDYITEIHFLEKKLGVTYRFDKAFSGQIIGENCIKTDEDSIFYCRNLECGYVPSAVELKNDLYLNNLVETWKIDDYNFKIDVVKFADVYKMIKEKIIENPKYLWQSIV